MKVGSRIHFEIEELNTSGEAEILAITSCPDVPSGDGSVVTGRFATRRVDRLAAVRLTDSDGRESVLEGTPIHPVWSVTRRDWIPLGELEPGELLQGESGLITVVSCEIHDRSAKVYNIEVHGEHVYEVGDFGVLVHNALSCLAQDLINNGNAKPAAGWFAAHIFPNRGFAWFDDLAKLQAIREKLANWNLLNATENGFWTDSTRHLGTHTKAYLEELVEAFKGVRTKERAIEVLDEMFERIKNFEWEP